MEPVENQAVTNFRRYLRIRSVHPNVNYDDCVKFLKEQAEELGLPITICNVAPGKPVVIITYAGTQPELPSLLLNSHMDVVPTFDDQWTHPPFAAEKDEKGNIYGRGAQDCKCLGIQYIEAVRRYIREGIKMKRTVHISFMTDEELTSGSEGMALFLKTDVFKKLNVGCALDECSASPNDTLHVRYGERSVWGVEITCTGTTGHGSILRENTAGEKLNKYIAKVFEFRDKELKKLKTNPELLQGDVTALNLTILSGGVQTNVVPPEFKAYFDVRVAIDMDHEKLENQFEQWRQEIGEGVQVKYLTKAPKVEVTKVDSTNTWWIAFKKESDKMGLKLKPVISAGGTDAKHIRKLGIPAFGFAPMTNTPTLLHANDEYLNENVFLRGIDIYYNLIKALASH